MVALDRLAVPGAIIIAVLATAAAGILLGVSPFVGIVSAPPSLGADLSRARSARRAASRPGDGRLRVPVRRSVRQYRDADRGGAPRRSARRARAACRAPAGLSRRPRSAAMGGAVLGTSTVTSYIESAAGVKAGGRTGLVGVTVAMLFLLTLFLAPLAHSVPVYATAPALLFVACMMARGFAELDWEDVDRIRAGGRHRAGDAADLLDRHRHRARLYRLCRGQAAVRPHRRGRAGDERARRCCSC